MGGGGALSYARSMVRLIPIEVRGRIVYAEDAPTHCPNGHEALRPGWRPCRVCLYACRHWQCDTCDELLRDYDHVHRA